MNARGRRKLNPDDPRYYADGAPVKEAGPLKTAKREKFALAVAEGKNQTDAYIESYGPQKNRVQAGKNAHALARCDDMKARIYELRLAHASDDLRHDADGHVTKDYVYRTLQELVADARMDNQLKLAKDIVTILGKEIGMFQEGKVDESQVKQAALPGPTNPTGNPAFSVQNLHLSLAGDKDRSGKLDGTGPIIDGEVSESVESDQPTD